jgi:hypothetical protein
VPAPRELLDDGPPERAGSACHRDAPATSVPQIAGRRHPQDAAAGAGVTAAAKGRKTRC